MNKNYTSFVLKDELVKKIKELLSLGYNLREISFLVNKSFNEINYLLSL